MPLLGGTTRDGRATAIVAPTHQVVLSWNATSPIDIDVRVSLTSGFISPWMPYVRTEPWRSCSPSEGEVRIETDTIRSDIPIVAVEARAIGAEAIFCASPPVPINSAMTRFLTHVPVGSKLIVPTKTQYIGEERGWCSPASLAMLMGYWAQASMRSEWDVDVATVAKNIYDPTYGGTGNWTFATAYAATLGLRGVVVYLNDLNDVYAILSLHVPLALSIAWEENELPGSPLPRSDGHILVVRGFDRDGNVLVNDPALPDIAGVYPRVAFEMLWLRAGGIAYVVAPPQFDAQLLPRLNV